MADKNDIFYDPLFDYDRDGELDDGEKADQAFAYGAASDEAEKSDDNLFAGGRARFSDRMNDLILSAYYQSKSEELRSLVGIDPGEEGDRYTADEWCDHFARVRKSHEEYRTRHLRRNVAGGTAGGILGALGIVSVWILTANQWKVTQESIVAAFIGCCFFVFVIIASVLIARECWKESREFYEKLCAACDSFEQEQFEKIKIKEEIAQPDPVPQEEDEQKPLKKKRLSILIPCLAVVAIFLCFLIPFVWKSVQTSTSYSHAEALIEEGDFESAAYLLKNIPEPEHLDTQALLALCKAHQYFDGYKIDKAIKEMEGIVFYHQSEEQMEKIRAFQEELDKVDHATTDLLEKYYPRGLEDDSEIGEGDWDTDPSDSFSGRSSGSVTVDSGSGRTDLPGRSLYDPPSVEGFVHPEDFYDWYRDDFADYEEAEDFYYIHGGE